MGHDPNIRPSNFGGRMPCDRSHRPHFPAALRCNRTIERGDATMAAITPDMKVGDIVRTWPETMRVFRSYNLNLHCGGVHSLAYVSARM